MPLPSRNSPSGLDLSESDFVILQRSPVDNGGHGNQQAELHSQFSPTSVTNGGTNYVTMMQFDQLVNTAKAMKEENNMLKGQLTEMTHMMDSRKDDFLREKNTCKQVKERMREIRESANDEVTRLRKNITTLETELGKHLNMKTEDRKSQDETADDIPRIRALEEKVNLYEAKLQHLESELKESKEEVVVTFASSKSTAKESTAANVQVPSLVTQLNEDINDVQATRLDFQTVVVDLQQALQKSGADLKRYKQRTEQLKLEKQDLLSLNNELQTMVSMYTTSDRESQRGSFDQRVAEMGSEFVINKPGESPLDQDAKQGAANNTGGKANLQQNPMSPSNVVQKTNIALQDVLLQLQAEREKVGNLMEDLKKEREDRNKIENTLMEQLQACSGEHSTAVEVLKEKHKVQVTELAQQLDLLTVANQEPHYSLELKHQVRSLVCELQEKENDLQQKENSAAKLYAQNEALKSKISLYHDELDQVRKQDSKMIETLRQELMRQQAMVQIEKQKGLVERMNHEKLKGEHEKLKDEFEKLKDEYEKLIADFDDLTRTLDASETRNRQAMNNNELAEQRDNLTAQLMSAEEAITVRVDQLEKARRELDAAKAKIETIPVLEAQAEIYKNDFDAERAAREKSHTEREQLMAEMENLREENQRMQEEVASQTKAQLQQMQHRHSTVSPGSSSGGAFGIFETLFPKARRAPGDPFIMTDTENFGADVDQFNTHDEAGTNYASQIIRDRQKRLSGHTPPPLAVNTCPKCQNNFPDIDTLQIHMLDCIE